MLARLALPGCRQDRAFWRNGAPLLPSTPTVAATCGSERGRQRGKSRGKRPARPGARPGLARAAVAGTVDDQARWQRGDIAGIAQGAGAARLSRGCAAGRVAQPSLRDAVGRAERSARGAALVLEQ